MPGELDPIYVRARRVLLDALAGLGEQRSAVTLVGAQAIYLHAGEADFAVAPFTEDADLGLRPELLLDAPLLAEAMTGADFTAIQPGIWRNPEGGQVDLLVPEALGGEGGRRGARLGPPHGNKVARRVRGLEAALVDAKPEPIRALEPGDDRMFEIAVAGPAGLLVAKLHKIAERVAVADVRRLDDKDALDVLRILTATETEALATTMHTLIEDELAGEVTRESVDHLRDLFAGEAGEGTQMAIRATAGLEDPDTIAARCSVLASDLAAALGTKD